MITIFNRLSVKEGAAGQIVERFANSWGNVQWFPGFVSMEVLRSDYIPQLRIMEEYIMEEYIGEDRPPLFT
jgi:heme-degrading monooxygenase HmoA